MTENIVLLDRYVLPEKLGRPQFPHQWTEYPATPAALIRDRLQAATIAITNRVPLQADILEELPQLRFIAVAATGCDAVDLTACERLNITVSNVRNWCTAAVVEHTFALVLALRRHMVDVNDQIRLGAWQRSARPSIPIHPLPSELAGASFGLIGFGVVAERVAAVATAFGANVLIAEHKGAASVRAGRVPFGTVLRECDIISIHCPLTEATRNLIDESDFEMMRPSALLINCARGGIVNEEALAKALAIGEIAGAGLDVLVDEPPCRPSPLLDLDSRKMIVTPHTAWASTSSANALAEQLIQNLESFVAGTPHRVVTSNKPNLQYW